MNRERRKEALKKNIQLTQDALAHANELIQKKDVSVVAFPDKTNLFIKEMERKLVVYRRELSELEGAE